MSHIYSIRSAFYNAGIAPSASGVNNPIILVDATIDNVGTSAQVFWFTIMTAFYGNPGGAAAVRSTLAPIFGVSVFPTLAEPYQAPPIFEAASIPVPLTGQPGPNPNFANWVSVPECLVGTWSQ
jgi:hypothetical protein